MKINYLIIWAFISLITFNSCSSDDSSNDVNSGPTITISDFTISIDENPENGFILGQIEATTNSGTLSYHLHQQLPNFSMEIDSETGILKVRDSVSFNFEKHPVLTAKIIATSDGNQKTGNVTITLNDIYEKYSFIGNVQLHSQEQVDEFGNEDHWGVSGFLLIGNNQGNITDLSPLASIVDVGSLYIENLEINSLIDFNNISEIENSLRITDNLMLNSIEGLSNNITIGTDVKISGNSNLINLEGFPNINSIGKDLTISNNSSLLNLNGLLNINSIGEDLTISGNNSLITLNGLPNFTNIPGNLTIRFNNQLNDITTLSSVNEIGGDLLIHQNDFLPLLSGLENLSQIGGDIIISNQIFLFNINEFSNLNMVTGDLNIINNPQLFNLCGIENLIINNGLEGDYLVEDNVYNPTIQDIIDGNCSN